VRRAAAWSLTIPLAALGVLLGHALAYRIVGEPPGDVHDYLAHAPQVMLVLATVAVAIAAFPRRAPGVGRAPIAAIALLGYVAQEHLERVAHSGELPWLLTDPAFVVGLALQIPIALACIALVRLVAGPPSAPRRRPPVVPATETTPPTAPARVLRPAPVPAARGRAPPIPSTG
jgi:hypothetical protein